MPTYDYRCKECDHSFEIQQSFSDDPLTTCPTCGGELRKVFSPVGIAFKGSGFYKTDSRGGSSRSTTSSADSATTGSGDSSSSGSGSGDSTSTGSGDSTSSGSGDSGSSSSSSSGSNEGASTSSPAGSSSPAA